MVILNMVLKTIILLMVLGPIQPCLSARILCLIPFTGKSHYINIQPILQRLAERGHDLTVVTTHYEKNPLPNYHQVILDNRTFWDSFGKDMDKFSFENMPFAKEMKMLWDGTYFSTEVAFNSSSLQEFIEKDNSHFDLVFIELFYQEAFYLFAHKYQAPIVAFNTMGFAQYIGDFIGNPLHLSFMPHEFLPLNGKMNIWKKLENIYYTLYDIIGRHLYVLPRHEMLLERHFKNLQKPWPRLQDLQRNVTLVLLNTHYSIDVVRPHIPGVVEIGGVHIKKAKKIPKDLQVFLDESEHGVVYFSLGSNLKSKDMPKDKIKMFLNAFSKLKQRVLWKWEDVNLPGKPDNVFTSPWLPQTDVLNHPNVKLFISHGGLLSTIEAVHFGVPIIGIPVFGDQHLNSAKAEKLGFGIKLLFSGLTEESITLALNEILTNSKYMTKAKELSSRFRDRPIAPMDSAIYWIEYVIKHKGASFIKSPVLDLKWYEFYMIDVILLISLSVILVGLVLAYSMKTLYKVIRTLLNTLNGKKNYKLKSK